MSKVLLKNRISKYEEAQKAKLVELGLSKKSYSAILSYLKDEIEKSTTICTFNYEIFCFKNDGVYQLNKAIEEIYGVASGKKDASPSGGTSKLKTIDVQLFDGTRLKVPYGKISLAEAGEGANIDISYDTERNMLMLTGSCEYRFAPMIDDIVERTKELLNTNSIYRNQALEITTLDEEPKVIDLSNIDKEFLILSDDVKYSLTPLDARIQRTDICKKKGISLKYGALLEGAYGWFI